ncbi:DNA repair protein xrcc3 [Dinochytrium kinnereticum]|nr:DNA repair protein xrcc3 [Dinochytrium kinnereticum]
MQPIRLTSLDDKLDTFLEGGFRTGCITEIFGEDATGKTQFALQLSLSVQLPLDVGGLDAGAAFITTQQKFPIARFKQLESHIKRRFPGCLSNASDSVYIMHAQSLDELEHAIMERLSYLFSGCRIRLVVIDSIVAHFQSETMSTDARTEAIQKSEKLFRIAQKLKNNRSPGTAMGKLGEH